MRDSVDVTMLCFRNRREEMESISLSMSKVSCDRGVDAVQYTLAIIGVNSSR